jgi:hypothetical protein
MIPAGRVQETPSSVEFNVGTPTTYLAMTEVIPNPGAIGVYQQVQQHFLVIMQKSDKGRNVPI